MFPFGTPSSNSIDPLLSTPNSLSSNGLPTLFGSPSLQMTTPPRSLFSLTPTPRAGPNSLFSIPSSAGASPLTLSTPFAGTLSSTPQSAGIPSISDQLSPNSLATPPSIRSTGSSNAPLHNALRSTTSTHIDLKITPSPFKTPHSSTSTQNRVLEASSMVQSPIALSNHTARALNFDELVDRSAAKRPHSESEQNGDSLLPAAKRPFMPWQAEMAQESPQFRIPSLPMRHTEATESNMSILQKNPSLVLQSPSTALGRGSLPPLTNLAGSQASPSAPLPPLAGQGLISQNSLRSPTFIAPTPISSVRTDQGAMHEVPQNNQREMVLSRPPLATINPSHPPTGLPNALIKTGGAIMSYSSYSAALAAKALLETTPEDDLSPNELRDLFSVETSNMATALEDLHVQVTDTSDLVHQLNLSLQLANNEVLLMNASMVTDDRLRALEAFFNGATAAL